MSCNSKKQQVLHVSFCLQNFERPSSIHKIIIPNGDSIVISCCRPTYFNPVSGLSETRPRVPFHQVEVRFQTTPLQKPVFA